MEQKAIIKVLCGSVCKSVAFDSSMTVRQALFNTASILGELGIEVMDVVNYNFFFNPGNQNTIFLAEKRKSLGEEPEGYWLDKKRVISSYNFTPGTTLEFKKNADFNSAVEATRRLSLSPKPSAGKLKVDDENENVQFLTKGRFTRNEATKEIVTTEQTYVEQLGVLSEGFITPVMDNNMIENKYVLDMFKQIRTIHSLHQEILQQMQERLDTWSSASGIGDVFLKIVPFLKIYGDYCLNYESNLTDLYQHAEDHVEFKDFIADCEQSERFTLNNLGAYLILPVQRIPRYRLLFEQLIKFTPKTHDDYPKLNNALDKINEVASYVNNYKGQDRKMFEANEKIAGLPENFELVIPSRRYVREAVLKTVTSRGSQDRRIFLFTDLLVYCVAKKPPHQYKGSILFDGSTWVNNLADDAKIKNAFQVVGKDNTVMFICSSPDEKQKWMDSLNAIETQIAKRFPDATKYELKSNKAGGFRKFFGKP